MLAFADVSVALQIGYAFALVGLLAILSPVAQARSLKQSSQIGDADVLNFALNLECLEAQFYSCAVYGQPLSDELTGYGPQPIGCQAANFTNDDLYSIAMDVANNEIAHVNYLRTALGNQSVQCPLVNIGDAFSAAANAALGTTLSPAFIPYVNDLYFLTGAFIFEDLGVTAYMGALGRIQSSDYFLAAAGKLDCKFAFALLACLCLLCPVASRTSYSHCCISLLHFCCASPLSFNCCSFLFICSVSPLLLKLNICCVFSFTASDSVLQLAFCILCLAFVAAFLASAAAASYPTLDCSVTNCLIHCLQVSWQLRPTTPVTSAQPSSRTAMSSPHTVPTSPPSSTPSQQPA